MLNTTDLYRINYFVCVAEEENIIAAARKLNITASSLSVRMKEFEEDVGAKLFLRSGNRISLTKAGKAFCEDMRSLITLYKRAVEKARSAGESIRKLRVGYTPSPTVQFREKTFTVFERENPPVRVVAREVDVRASMKQLLRGDLHLALVVKPPSPWNSTLNFEPLATYPVCCAVASQHRFVRRKTVSAQDIRGETILGFSREEVPQYYEYFNEWFAPNPPPIADDYDGIETLLAAVAKGDGVAVLLSSAGQMNANVRMVAIKPRILPVVVGALYPKPPSDMARALVMAAKATIASV